MNFLKWLKPERNFLFFIFFLTLAVRLVYVIPLSPEKLSPDAFDWMNIAWRVVSECTYGDTWRPPGYITYLASIFFVFGKSVLAARVFNVLLGAITCVIIYFVGKKIFVPRVGRIASLLLTFYPYLVAYSGDLLSETFLTFTIALAILGIINASERPHIRNLALSGFFMGLASLTKSTIMPFFLFACVWLWWQTKSFKAAFLTGIFVILTIGPWTLRNYLYYGKFILVSPGYQSLWVSNNDEAMVLETIGEKDSPAPNDWAWTPARYTEYLKLPRMESEALFKKEAFEWIRNNPEKFRWLMYRRLIHFWRLYPKMAYRWQKRVAMATSGVYIPLCVVGIFLSLKNFKKTSLLVGLFASYTFVHLFFLVTLRYRVPIDPYIIIFASYTLLTVYEKLILCRNRKYFVFQRV